MKDIGSKALSVMPLAPSSNDIDAYDMGQMLTYARLIDAERAGVNWRVAASNILCLDVDSDVDGANRCWRSHLDRAQWVTGAGLSALIDRKSNVNGQGD